MALLVPVILKCSMAKSKMRTPRLPRDTFDHQRLGLGEVVGAKAGAGSLGVTGMTRLK